MFAPVCRKLLFTALSICALSSIETMCFVVDECGDTIEIIGRVLSIRED